MAPQQQPGAPGGGNGPLQGMPQAQAGATPDGGPAAQSAQPDPNIGTPGGDQQTDPQEQMKNYVDSLLQEMNIAKKLKKTTKGKKTLADMASKVLEGYEADVISREGWLERNKEWMNLAMLVRENKSFPWPKASNVKYPLLATAAMQFSARAYPALVPSDGHIVKTKIVQKDPTDQIYAAAERVGQHMSYQLLERMPNWEEDMDKLLMTMAISGICFKKTYHSSLMGCHHSHIVYPENFVVNYYAKSLEKAYRKSEILRYTDNEVKERVNNDEEFLDVDLSCPTVEEDKSKLNNTGTTPPPPDESTPNEFISCHTFWDLDDDGYEEPYVITIHKDTRQVVRIIARWSQEGVKMADDNKKIIRIEPVEYFTAFPFIPNPDGSIYALGFGLLLGPLNESVNSIINQLIDAGTLNNLQSGFIGKGLRLRMGQTSLQPGEFKVVNATAEDLQKGVFVMPTKEPSNVLFQLMNMLVTSGNQLASIAEIFVGKMPGQNTPATTTQDTIQQGMAVFTAIYKRVYRSLAQEFKKIYWLNKINPDIVAEEGQFAGIELQASDYDLPDWVLIPGADPTGDSGTVRMAKLQQVGQLLQMGTIDPMVYTRLMLDANEIPNAQSLIKQPAPPPPDPVAQAKAASEQAKASLLQQKGQQDAQSHQQDMAAGQQDVQSKQALAQIAQQAMSDKAAHAQTMQAMDMQGAQNKLHQNMVEQTLKQHADTMQTILETLKTQVQHNQDIQNTQQKHVQGSVQEAQAHHQTLTLAAQKSRQEARLKAQQPKTK
jgi:chaperonin GroES